MEFRKPRLLIIGHARHGKDTLAQKIADLMGLKFTSSSHFVGEKCVWPHWGQERYETYEEMFEDRVNFRSTWHDLIAAYNTPDKSRTASEMLAEGNDMYVGMRATAEWDMCMERNLFDHVIWVDASARLPKEHTSSNQMTSTHADIYIDNNGPESNLDYAIKNLQLMLNAEGFNVGYSQDNLVIGPDGMPSEPTEEDDRKAWEQMPEGATQVLDHGFFKVLEVMGSDDAICNAARMSYGRGTKKVNSNEGLINYLVRNHHTSPLEMGEIKFHMRLPIFVMRQWVRHRTANLNEYSGRYSQMVRLFYVPDQDKICTQHKVNKQGSAEPLDYDVATSVRSVMTQKCDESFDAYEAMLEIGVSRETARMILPLNTYTEVVWKMDVNNLLKFLRLRDDDHAQWEIQVYAKLIAQAVKENFPLVYAAYENTRASTNLTPLQIESLIKGELLEGLSKSEGEQVRQLIENEGLSLS